MSCPWYPYMVITNILIVGLSPLRLSQTATSEEPASASGSLQTPLPNIQIAQLWPLWVMTTSLCFQQKNKQPLEELCPESCPFHSVTKIFPGMGQVQSMVETCRVRFADGGWAAWPKCSSVKVFFVTRSWPLSRPSTSCSKPCPRFQARTGRWGSRKNKRNGPSIHEHVGPLQVLSKNFVSRHNDSTWFSQGMLCSRRRWDNHGQRTELTEKSSDESFLDQSSRRTTTGRHSSPRGLESPKKIIAGS